MMTVVKKQIDVLVAISSEDMRDAIASLPAGVLVETIGPERLSEFVENLVQDDDLRLLVQDALMSYHSKKGAA